MTKIVRSQCKIFKQRSQHLGETEILPFTAPVSVMLVSPTGCPKKNSDKILNPFTPKSVWLIICPYSITLESNVKVTRLIEIISNSRSSRLSRKFPCQYYRKCLEDSVKNINAYVRHEYGHVPRI